MRSARIVLWVIDATRPENVAATSADVIGNISDDQTLVAVINKTDAAGAGEVRSRLAGLCCDKTVEIAASKGNGIEALEQLLVEISGAADISATDVIVTNARHHRALVDAEQSITRAIDGINTSLSGDFIAQDLRETLHHLSTITGTITTDTILQNIFQNFCIGK